MSSTSKKKKVEIIKWSTKERKFEQLLYSLREIKSKTEDAKKTTSLLCEVIPVLERTQFQYPTKDNNETFQRVRCILLELWNLLLISSKNFTNYLIFKNKEEEKVEENEKKKSENNNEAQENTEIIENQSNSKSEPKKSVQTVQYLKDENDYYETFDKLEMKKRIVKNSSQLSVLGDNIAQSYYSDRDMQIIHKAICLIMIRKEFDTTHLHFDQFGHFECSQTDLKIAYRYRILLYQTQIYTQQILEIQSKKEIFEAKIYLFASKVISITSNRIPIVNNIVINAISLSKNELVLISDALDKYYNDKYENIDITSNVPLKKSTDVLRISSYSVENIYDNLQENLNQMNLQKSDDDDGGDECENDLTSEIDDCILNLETDSSLFNDSLKSPLSYPGTPIVDDEDECVKKIKKALKNSSGSESSESDSSCSENEDNDDQSLLPLSPRSNHNHDFEFLDNQIDIPRLEFDPNEDTILHHSSFSEISKPENQPQHHYQSTLNQSPIISNALQKSNSPPKSAIKSAQQLHHHHHHHHHHPHHPNFNNCAEIDLVSNLQLCEKIQKFYSNLLKSNALVHEKKELLNHTPNLFQWPLYHGLMEKYKYDTLEKQITSEGEWVEILKQKKSFYFLFVANWVKYMKHELLNSDFEVNDWEIIVGYDIILRTLLFALREIKFELDDDVIRCSRDFLYTSPILINFYIENLFSATNVFDVPVTLQTISYLEKFLIYFIDNNIELPEKFNIKYFCKGLDIILQTDHYQLISKLISLIYNTESLFRDIQIRQYLIIDLILHKYFFYLFLHWDFTVRNSFHQLLVFKIMKKKMSELMLIETVNNIENITDMLIMSKVSSYLRIIEERVHLEPKSMLTYVPSAMSEYRAYLNFQKLVQSNGKSAPKNLIPYTLLPSSVK